MGRFGKAPDDLSWRDIKMRDSFIKAVHVTAAKTLPHFDAARVHELWRVSFSCGEQPGNKCPQALRLVLSDALHDVMVVAEQDVKSFVDAGRIRKFLVSVAGT